MIERNSYNFVNIARNSAEQGADGMKQPVSIFNEVIGPVMVGPSSSHTAAFARIGLLVRGLCGGQPRQVTATVAAGSSLAETYLRQGTDQAFAAGLLGYAPADARLPRARALARESGVALEFRCAALPADHPNLLRVAARGADNAPHRAEFLSVGGGMLRLRRLDGFAVDIDGSAFETLLRLPDATVGAEAAALLRRQADESSALFSHTDENNGLLLELRAPAPLPDGLWERLTAALPDGASLACLPPVLPVRWRPRYDAALFDTAAATLAVAMQEGRDLAGVATLYEARRSGLREDEVLAQMREIVLTLRRTVALAAGRQSDPPGCILGRQARLLGRAPAACGPAMLAVLRHVTLLMEAKTALLPIVAAPTAGACGALPGALLGLGETLGADDDAVARAMLAAGMVGVFIAAHSTFAGEICGCQAECGSGSGMAAAGIAQLLGGSAGQALDAAAMALQSTGGLICDPVAARVEVPCLGKNILAATNAMAMAELALAGFDAVIPLDETIAALYVAGQSLPATLRCTGRGGLSLAPAAQRIQERLG